MCLTEKEFNNLWFRTGNDPFGNKIEELIIGGDDSSYEKYILEFQKNNFEVKFDNSYIMDLQKRKLYIWRSMDDDKVRSEHLQNDDKIFDWESDDIKPGEDYGCRCYAEFLDDDGEPNGIYGKIAWPDKEIEKDPKPYFKPCDKNGIPLSERKWGELTEKERDLRKLEELEKFKNSDELRENIKKAKEMKEKGLSSCYSWFIDQVKGDGPWDYKRGGHPEMEHVGNFNYGATGRAMGVPSFILRGAAGFYQFTSGTSKLSFVISFGDDPVDQYFINEGIEWYYDFENNIDF